MPVLVSGSSPASFERGKAAERFEDMSWLGKLIAAPVRIINAPLAVAENVINKTAGVRNEPTRDGILSGPLELVAEAIEETTDEIVGE